MRVEGLGRGQESGALGVRREEGQAAPGQAGGDSEDTRLAA